MEPLTTNEIERLDLRLSANPDTYVDPDIVRRLIATVQRQNGPVESRYFCPFCFGQGRLVRLFEPSAGWVAAPRYYCPAKGCNAQFADHHGVETSWQALATMLAKQMEAA